MQAAIGLLEFSSIAKGYLATDAMLKAGHVELVLARTICPGKYLALVTGEVAAVESAIQAGKTAGAEAVVDEFIIPNVHPQVFPAITATSGVFELNALGIIETFSVAASIEAADAAVKAANVDLIEIRVAMAIGGKGFVTLTGEVADVQSAIEAGAEIVQQKGLLVNKVIIPAPRKELLRDMV